jgi:hypothetical protein
MFRLSVGAANATAGEGSEAATTTTTGLQLLDEARGLLARGWCRGADARDASGSPVEPWAAEAETWSLLGAIVAALEREAAATGEMALDELSAALYALATVVEADSLVAWNDLPGRNQLDVLRALDAAAAAYRPPWLTISASAN